MISNGIKGIEMTQIIPVIILNCSGRCKISDRKEQRKVIDLEMHGPAKQPRQNPTKKKNKVTEFCIMDVIA